MQKKHLENLRPIHDNNLSENSRGELLQLDKDYKKPTATIILNGEILERFPLRSGTRQGYFLSLFLYKILLVVLASSIRQGNEMKDLQIGKEIIKICVCS